VFVRRPNVFVGPLHVFVRRVHVFVRQSHMFVGHFYVFVQHLHLFVGHLHVFVCHLHGFVGHLHGEKMPDEHVGEGADHVCGTVASIVGTVGRRRSQFSLAPARSGGEGKGRGGVRPADNAPPLPGPLLHPMEERVFAGHELFPFRKYRA
jgi:hypothetical protein